nr:type II toxin-antitoxin system RelB/DinJ family antitoxin [Providencia rettgeri]
MGSINLRIDDELKARSYAALEKMGVTPSEALRLMLEYIADNERLPFKQTLLSDEDAELVEIVKERLRKPKPVRVTLDELWWRIFWILTSGH